MKIQRTWCALPLLIAASAMGQPLGESWLYALNAGGDLIRLDPLTGAGQLVGSSGVQVQAGSVGGYEWILAASHAAPGELASINHWTGASGAPMSVTGVPPGYTISGLASGTVLLDADNGGIDLLGVRNFSNATITIIGPTGRSDLEDLAIWWSPGGPQYYALGRAGGGSGSEAAIYALNGATGAATLIGGSNLGDSKALEFLSDGRLLACGSNLLEVNPATGAATLIGPTGFSNIRALVLVHRRSCYADCQQCSWCSPPLLNVAQFTCFLQNFSVGSPYANCDQSTTPPVLNVADFTCFLQKFAAGCP